MTVATMAARFAAIALIDPLHHFFAPLVLEIDIDIRWFLAFRTREKRSNNEPIRVFRIDGRDAKAITDRGIGSGAAALAKNIVRAGMCDDVVDRQEIGRVFEPVPIMASSFSQKLAHTLPGMPSG